MFQLLDCSPLPQFAVGLDNKITYWNKACELLTGFAASEMIGTDRHWEPFYSHKRPLVADLVLHNDIKTFFTLYQGKNPGQSRVIPNGWEAFDWFTMCGRRLKLFFTAAPVRDEHGRVVGAVESLQDLSLEPLASLTGSGYFAGSPESEKSSTPTLITTDYKFGELVGKSQPMQEVYTLISQAAQSDANVIIYGESGTGKELVAKTIHQLSPRRQGNFVAVNCGAVPESLAESEFFGYKRGAFTGASSDREGYLDRADRGTLFLDEIGEISIPMQVKLLRVLDGYGFSPVGSREIHKPDLRIIGATSRNIEELLSQGKIRKDFYYRIHVIPLRLPPLRERKSDIPLLVEHLLTKILPEKPCPPLPQEVMDALMDYHWPGNVRELQNVLHRYLTLNRLEFEDVQPVTRPLNGGNQIIQPVHSAIIESSPARLAEAIEEFERQMILKALEQTRWHRSQAAHLLGISRKTLFRKMRQYGIG